jgi:hypothetical protein
LSERDLAADAVAEFLNFTENLSPRLLSMSLSTSRPSLKEVDKALSGEKTAAAKKRLSQFRTQLSNELASLKTRQSAVKSRLSQRKSKMSSIENARPPTEPVAPSTVFASDEEKRLLLEQHAHNLARYGAAVALYNANRGELVQLRAEAAELEREFDGLTSAIANHGVRARAEERAFLEEILEARDRDLLVELHRALEGASVAFRSEGNPLKGFWTLLGADCLRDFFEEFIGQPAAVTQANLAFSKDAESLLQPMRQGLPEIAKWCLAGPTAIHQAIAANKETLAALTDRLAKVPTDKLEEGRRSARQLLDVPEPSIPKYDHLEDPVEIDRTAFRLHELRSGQSSYLALVKAEIDGEPSELRSEIELALADAESCISEIRDMGAKYSGALARSRTLWELIRRGSSSAHLPALAQTLCTELRHESVRRLMISVETLIDRAVDSKFGLEDAQALLDNHVVVAYVADQNKIRQRLVDGESTLNKIEASIRGIEGWPDQVSKKYRRRLIVIAAFAIVPGVGIGLSIWGFFILRRLKPLVMSDKPAYVRLGDFACDAMQCAAAVSGAATIAAAAIAGAAYSNDFLDMSYGTLTCSLAIVFFTNFAILVTNILTARGHLHARRRRIW